MISELEKMLGGELYDPYAPELIRKREQARDLCRTYNLYHDSQRAERRQVLGDLLGHVGDNVSIQPPFYCDYGFNLSLGDNVFFNFNCVVLDVCPVRVGAFTLFGPAVQIYTATHPLDPILRRQQESGKPVDIGSDVWVGGGAILLPGITIGSGSVIGAGSVVTRSIPSGVFAAGNPCRVIRQLTAP